MHLIQRRLPPARIFSVLTADGVELRLLRLRGGDRGPVVLAPGYAMSTRAFTLDTLETNLAGYLCERDLPVWEPGCPVIVVCCVFECSRSDLVTACP
jgi:hypothetical protein